jgi:uncharacterized membrane protein YfcA
MVVAEAAGLVGVGVVAGVVSTVVSLASLVSYPALLAFGLPPLSANVTNTVALLFTGLGAAAGSRPELVGQGRRVLRLGVVTALGGATGAALLLVTPSDTFGRIAPWLIALASLLLLRPPQRGRAARPPWAETELRFRCALFGVAIYVGYFGAAGGILLLAVLSTALAQPLTGINAIKNVISGMANGVAAIGFALFGPVDWGVALPLAAGFVIGGWIGPAIARRLPGQTLRYAAALCGLAVSIKLGLDAYR